MRPTVSRREFFKTTAAVAGGLVVSPALPADDKLDQVFKISLAQWSLHRGFGRGKKGTLDPLQFAAMTKKDFGISAVEYVNSFYKDHKKDDAYLKDLKKVADDNGVVSVLIMCD